jgi:hypothetical protein
MTNGSLILHPKNPAGNPAPATGLICHLGAVGLLGDPLEPENRVFRVGSRFLQLISFLGCSPYLQLDPPKDGSDNFCHIVVHGPFETPRLLYGEGVHPPRCPGCGAALKGWKEGVDSDLIRCGACGTNHSPGQIAWGKHAGYGCLFVEIRNIFPGEAIPVAELMSALQDLGLGEWGHFYLQGCRECS